MTTESTGRETYAEALARLARALTTDAGAIPAFAPDEAAAREMELFVEENRDKRTEKLRRSLGLLADAFDDLDGLFDTYTRERTWAVGEDGVDRGEFLHWLAEAVRLTPKQRDYIACQQARDRVESQARRNRKAYIRFQEHWSVAGELAGDLPANPDLGVELNPIREWARFETPVFLGNDAPTPAVVLFFACRGDIRTAVLEPPGRALVEELAGMGRCTLGGWAAVSRHADREELIPLCRDLAEMGLVAFS